MLRRSFFYKHGNPSTPKQNTSPVMELPVSFPNVKFADFGMAVECCYWGGYVAPAQPPGEIFSADPINRATLGVRLFIPRRCRIKLKDGSEGRCWLSDFTGESVVVTPPHGWLSSATYAAGSEGINFPNVAAYDEVEDEDDEEEKEEEANDSRTSLADVTTCEDDEPSSHKRVRRDLPSQSSSSLSFNPSNDYDDPPAPVTMTVLLYANDGTIVERGVVVRSSTSPPMLGKDTNLIYFDNI